MNIIRELSSISKYKPSKGDLLTLYQLTQDPAITRVQAADLFGKSPSHFRNTYKLLKDKLIDGILSSRFKGYSKKSAIEISILRKHAVFSILRRANKVNSAVKIGEELIAIVEKRGLLDIALEVSKYLAIIYSSLGDKKYLKYNKKSKYLMRLVVEQQQMQFFSNVIIFRMRKNKPITDLLKQLPQFDALAATNEHYKFKLLYYNTYYLIHQMNNDIDLLTKNNEAALFYCATTSSFVPEAAVSHLLFNAIPIYIFNKQFAEAEAAVKKYKKHNKIGSNNWNVALQYLTILGFQNNKPQIAANTFLKLKSIKGLKQTVVNKSRWHILHAFLHLYHAVGIIDFEEPFKLHKFLNEIASTKNDSLMRNGYALELIHLLVAKNHRAYQQRAENIEQYISRYLKGSKNARTKYFMRMLRSVALGGFHPVRVQAHAKKNRKKLEKTPRNLHLVDIEIVPYDKIWEIVILILSDQNDVG